MKERSNPIRQKLVNKSLVEHALSRCVQQKTLGGAFIRGPAKQYKLEINPRGGVARVKESRLAKNVSLLSSSEPINCLNRQEMNRSNLGQRDNKTWTIIAIF